LSIWEGTAGSSFAAMKKLVFLIVCLLTLGLHPIASDAANPDIVVVRIHESETMVRVVISHGEGKDEVVEFPTGALEKRLTASANGYHKMLSKLYQEGYSLKSTFSASGINVTSTTLIFAKDH
jgi:hypothetical protein